MEQTNRHGKHTNGKRYRQPYDMERMKLQEQIQTCLTSFHPVHVLSNHEYAKIKDNNIVLENVKFVMTQSGKRNNQHTVYTVSEENIGKNVKGHVKPLTHDNVVRIERIKRRFMTVTTKISSDIIQEKRIKLIGNSKHTSSSGMILLMIATFDDKIGNDLCVDEYVDTVRKSRYSIKLGNMSKYHYGTSGESYGIGLVAKYNIDQNGYSFGPYAEKRQLPKKKIVQMSMVLLKSC